MLQSAIRIAAALLVGGLFCGPECAVAKAPFTAEAMMKLLRIDDPQLSPDGKTVAFSVQSIDLPNNTKPSAIYVVPIDGGTPLRLTNDGITNTRPRWMPDGKRLLFISDRSNGSQVWSMNADGSDQKPLTDVPTEAGGETVSPDGKLLLFTSDVFPQCAPADAKPGVAFDRSCDKENIERDAAAKMKARVYTSLLYRHWTGYSGPRKQHILMQSLTTGQVTDMTPGALAIPPFSTGGPEQYVFSPDSTQIIYVANVDPDLSVSTNSDLFAVSVTGGEAHRVTNNPAGDDGPLYSPDGKYLAYRTQTRAGYESDQWRLSVLELATGKLTNLTETLDRWVDSYVWSHDSQRIFFTTLDHGTTPLMLTAPTGGSIRTVAQGPTTIGSVQFSADDKTMIFTEQNASRPVEIKRAYSKGGAAVPLTHLNDAVLNDYDLSAAEKIAVNAGDGAKVECYLIKPPGFNPLAKYPVLFAIHGGPEGEWGESWTYRWNAQVLAAAGYLVVLPNPRGSVGYGQAFTDGVNGDWGGRAYDDIMAVVDYVSALPYVDKERFAAAGASYGGYMIDWMLGHTDRFRAFVTHAGVYDLASEAGTTEELWFPKWEFQGFPWENSELYSKFSPSSYVKNFKTPTLVTHGEIDYRVPIGQGQQLFTALQQTKVPSKLVQFPDEGHWIQKPQNSVFWYNTVLDWLNQYTRAPAVGAPATVQ